MPKKLPPLPEPGSLKLRKTLSMPSLLDRVRGVFNRIADPRQKKPHYSLADVLMSGLALFGLKDGSLLIFDNQREETCRRHNLKKLYGVEKAPCDTQLRTVLDQVNPHSLRAAFRVTHQELQKQGVLEQYRFLGKFLVSFDGTGLFNSSHVSCPECCSKQHKNGDISYYHPLLAAVIVHPEKSTVLPFYPEAITRRDGSNKNDCEHNAAQRLIDELRKDFPRLDMIALHDALACNGPHIQRLKAHGFSYIITAKPPANSLMLKTVLEGLDKGTTQELEHTDQTGVIRGYRFANAVPLNHEHRDLKVNFIDYWEIHPNGKRLLYACVTDIPLTADNVADVVKAGRSRWKVENETFNTLKNQGYHLEHNYGHGRQHLSTVLATLMMLAFLLDQVQESCCRYFQAARHRYHSRKLLWEKLRGYFTFHFIDSWESLFATLIWGGDCSVPPPWLDSG
jgi:hypothetical protein